MDTVKDDKLRWGRLDEDVEDRIRWHSLIELGVLQDRHPFPTTADYVRKRCANTHIILSLSLYNIS